MPGHARRSRLVALGLSVGGVVGLVTGMVVNERPVAEPVAAEPTTVAAPDPFVTGPAATPASAPPTSRARRTITSAS